MNWPPIDVTINGETTAIYLASTLAHTINTDTETTLNIASDYARKYQRTLPLTITDMDGTHYLEVHPDGQVTASEQPPTPAAATSTRKKAKAPIIITVAAVITLAATALAGGYLYTHTLAHDTEGQTQTVTAERTIEATDAPTPTTSPSATPSTTPTPATTATSKPTDEQPPAPAQPAQPVEPAQPVAPVEPAAPAGGKGTGWTLTDMSTTVSSNTGQATFTVTQVGGSVPTTVTIAGQTRTFTGTTTITGIPSGTYPWTTEADGLTNSGSIYIP